MPNPKHIIDGYWNLLFKDKDIEPIAKTRLFRCMKNDCGMFSPFAGGLCKQCGCPLAAKTRCVECKCELGKW